MLTKKHLASLGMFAFLLFAIAGSASAYNHGQKFKDLSSEKQIALEKMFDEQHDKTEPLRDQLFAKNLELDALSKNPNTQPAQIKQLVNEITELRKNLRTQRQAFAAKVEKDFGIDLQMGYEHGRGMGRGRDGDHDKRGRGRNGHNGGWHGFRHN